MEHRYPGSAAFVALGSRRKVGFGSYFSQNIGKILFTTIVVFPISCAILFYGVIASDRYISEAQFIVRGVNGVSVGGLSVLLRTFGIARSNDDAFAIHSYMQSRDAASALQDALDLREIYRRPEADFLTRFGTVITGTTNEQFFDYYEDQVTLLENIETGITTLRVSSYRPEDSRQIAEKLLSLSELRINEMNARARADSLRVAQASLTEAADEVVAKQLELTRFRNRETLINPQDTAKGNLEVIASLTGELVQDQVRLRQMETSSPSNPNIPSVRGRIESLENQIESEKAKLTGSDEAISSKLGQYEELLLRRTLAEKAYEAASNSIDQARQEAARKQIYLEAIVRPNLPDKATEPQRLRRIVTVSFLSLVLFAMAYLIVSGSREHLNIH